MKYAYWQISDSIVTSGCIHLESLTPSSFLNFNSGPLMTSWSARQFHLNVCSYILTIWKLTQIPSPQLILHCKISNSINGFNYPATQNLKSGTHFWFPTSHLLSKPGNLPSATLPSQPNLEKFDTSLHMIVYWQIKVLLQTRDWLCPLPRDDWQWSSEVI